MSAESSLTAFFGESGAATELKRNPYYQNTHELPDAYVGRNHFLMSTLDYLITKDGRDFLTKVILPFEQTDSTNVAWEVFHFDRNIADVEPEQGVPQFVTVKHEVNSNRLVRRGLAFQIEHGFYTTDIGRRHYTMNIQQIVDAVEETTALQALDALVQTPDYYEKNANTDTDDGKKAHLMEQLSRFGLVQRGDHGMHLLDSDLKDALLRQNIRPDAYIMPPRSISYINMRDPYMTEYNRGGRGADALAALDASPTFRGTRVYEARYFETDYVNQPMDPMRQVITYGEWYPDATDIYVFDMETDDWVKVDEAKILARRRGREGRGERGERDDEEGEGEELDMAEVEADFGFLPRNLEFRRFKGIKSHDDFVNKYLPTIDAAHRKPVMAHLATLDAGSVVRPSYITDYIKTL